MKKQILILTFFVAAILAGTNAFAQTPLLPGITGAPTNQLITPLACVAGSEALHPYPGIPYVYTMDGESGIETTNEWTWFATKDQTFIDLLTNTLNTAGALTTATGDLLATAGPGGGANYATATVDANSITITWSAEILAGTDYHYLLGTGTPTFVVGYATGDNCADNIQVYEINPQFNFTIDIANIDPTATPTTLGWDVDHNSCVDVVREAVYNTTSFELDMDYGTNVLLFEVAAANFVTDFTPTFRVLGGLVDVQTAVMTLHSTLASAQDLLDNGVANSAWAIGDVDAGGLGTAWNSNVQFDATNATDVVTGVSLYVRVVVSNLTYESLVDNPFILAVDAQDQTQAGIWDMEDEDCPAVPATAVDAADWVDQSTHTVTPRPTILHATPDAGAPFPTNVVPKEADVFYPRF